MIIACVLGLVLLRVFYLFGEMYYERDWPRRTWRGLITALVLLLLCASAFAQSAARVDIPLLTSGPYVPLSGGPLPQALWVANSKAYLCAHPSATLGACQASLITTYTDATMGTPCSTSVQLVQLPGNTCVSATGAAANIGAWIAPSSLPFDYWLVSSYGTYGPFTFNPATGSSVGCPTTGCAFTGPISTPSINGIVNAAVQTGGDIGAKINASFASCTNACAVFVPAGTYSFATTIIVPVTSLTGVILFGAGANTVLNYTGSGDVIAALGTGQSQVGLTIRDLQITPASTAAAAVHLKAFNLATLQNVMVKGAGSGNTDCLLNEGANGITINNPNFSSCKNGVHDIGTVVSAVGYSANAVNIFGGQIFGNTLWGRYEDGTASATPGCNASNADFGVTYDFNGSSGSGGNLFIQCAIGYSAFGNYFEYAGATVHTAEVTLGDGTYQAKNSTFGGNQFFSAGTVADTFNDVNSAGTSVLAGNTEYGAVTNYYNHGTASRNTTITLGNLATAAGTFFAGVDTGGDTVAPCALCINGLTPGAHGWAYNTITGYANHLVLREGPNPDGTIFEWQNQGGTQKGHIDNSGNAFYLGALQGYTGITVGSTGQNIDTPIEMFPSVSGNNIWWFDNLAGALRISDGGSPGTVPMTYDGTGTLSPFLGFQIGGANATTGHYLRGNATRYVDSTIQAADIPTVVPQSTATQTAGQVVCIKTTGPPATYGTCTALTAATGVCSVCN